MMAWLVKKEFVYQGALYQAKLAPNLAYQAATAEHYDLMPVAAILHEKKNNFSTYMQSCKLRTKNPFYKAKTTMANTMLLESAYFDEQEANCKIKRQRAQHACE